MPMDICALWESVVNQWSNQDVRTVDLQLVGKTTDQLMALLHKEPREIKPGRVTYWETLVRGPKPPKDR